MSISRILKSFLWKKQTKIEGLEHDIAIDEEYIEEWKNDIKVQNRLLQNLT